ncbi:Rv1733c family protein [Streptomyces phaeochromogenes]
MAGTSRARATRVWLWRWRVSPLRRRSDRAEAWIVLGTWLLALLGAVLAGVATADAMERGMAENRARTRAVSAVLTQDATESGTESALGTVRVKVRWTDANGGSHTDRTKADADATAGTMVTVWVNREDELVSKPVAPSEARLQAAAGCVLVALGAGTAVLVAGRLPRAFLERRRLAEWEAEWERVGPGWKKRMLG